MAGTTALVQAFDGALPRIGFAPGGTVSTVARNWGFRGREAAYAARIVARRRGRLRRGRSKTDAARAATTSGGDRVGFIFGAGLVASFFDAYD